MLQEWPGWGKGTWELRACETAEKPIEQRMKVCVASGTALVKTADYFCRVQSMALSVAVWTKDPCPGHFYGDNDITLLLLGFRRHCCLVVFVLFRWWTHCG